MVRLSLLRLRSTVGAVTRQSMSFVMHIVPNVLEHLGETGFMLFYLILKAFVYHCAGVLFACVCKLQAKGASCSERQL
jgi:hypothetical protein